MNVKVPSRKVLVAVILSLSLLLVSFAVYHNLVIAGFEGAQEDLPFYVGAPLPYSYVVDCNSTTFFKYNGTTGYLDASSSNDDSIIQWSIDNCTVDGGSVFVRQGSYTASVTLKDNVTLTIETGASGITVSIDSGATAWLYDHENDEIKHWSAGSLVHYIRDGQVLLSEKWITKPLQEASYIIGEYNSTHYYGRNSTGYGTVVNEGYEFLSTNASYVVESAADSLPNGGNIHFTAGTHTLNTTIELYGYTVISGEGFATILQLGAAVDMFHNKGYGTTQAMHVGFRDILLDGAKSTNNAGHGIKGEFRSLNLINVRIQNFYQYGMNMTNVGDGNYGRVRATNCFFSSNRGGGVVLNSPDSEFVQCHFGQSGGDQLRMEGSGVRAGANHYVEACHFYSSGQGLGLARGIAMLGFQERHKIIGCEFEHLDKEAIFMQPGGATNYIARHVILGNTFYDIGKNADDTYPVIHMDGVTNGGHIKYNKILGNDFGSTEANEPSYNVFGNGSLVQHNIVTENAVYNAVTAQVYFSDATANTVSQNKGHKTEKLLYYVQVNTGETAIAHGLDVTPNIALVTPRVSSIVWRSSAANATHIHLQASVQTYCEIYVAFIGY